MREIHKTQQERGLPRYDAVTEPWRHRGMYFTCEDCGGLLRPDYRQGFRYPEEREPPPLRKIAWEQLLLFGRTLCRDCCRREIETRGITDQTVIQMIIP